MDGEKNDGKARYVTETVTREFSSLSTLREHATRNNGNKKNNSNGRRRRRRRKRAERRTVEVVKQGDGEKTVSSRRRGSRLSFVGWKAEDKPMKGCSSKPVARACC